MHCFAASVPQVGAPLYVDSFCKALHEKKKLLYWVYISYIK